MLYTEVLIINKWNGDLDIKVERNKSQSLGIRETIWVERGYTMVERGTYAFILYFNETWLNWTESYFLTNRMVICFTISIAGCIYFGLFYYISSVTIYFSSLGCWDTRSGVSHVRPGSKRHHQSTSSGQAVVSWCWVTSPSLFCCCFGQKPK